MINTDYLIRRAEPGDAEGIAKVNIQSWKETYPSIMPEARMANLNLERCQLNWENNLRAEEVIFVAELTGDIIGFVSGGKNRLAENCTTGLANNSECELTAMYILQDYHGLGIGKALFNQFVQAMISSGYKSMTIWVAEKNPATGFYAKMGGIQSDSRILTVCDQPVPLVAFCYSI